MQLVAFLADQKLKPTAFAGQIGVAASTITRLIKGERKASLRLAMKIEAFTGGLVTARDLQEQDTEGSDNKVEVAA